MDLAEIAAGMATAKSGFETLRTALGLVRDVQGALPAGEKKDAVAAALAAAETQARLAEAEIAKALGYNLCSCAFPPTPMLKVGRITRAQHHRDVHECPRCGQDDAYPVGYDRRVPPRVVA
jgi:hypothetical protein